jgi:hypothetical protein
MALERGQRGGHHDLGAVIAPHRVKSDSQGEGSPESWRKRAAGEPRSSGLFFFGNDTLAAIVTIGADVVTAMSFAGGRVFRQRRVGEAVVRTTHATAGRGFAILLNGHA